MKMGMVNWLLNQVDLLCRVVLTAAHLVAEMAAVSILHVEEFPPLYHRSSELKG